MSTNSTAKPSSVCRATMPRNTVSKEPGKNENHSWIFVWIGITLEAYSSRAPEIDTFSVNPLPTSELSYSVDTRKRYIDALRVDLYPAWVARNPSPDAFRGESTGPVWNTAATLVSISPGVASGGADRP